MLAKTKGCCYSCLGNGHTVRECRNRNSCGTEQCKRQHHPSLHSSHKAEDTQAKNVFHSTREVEGEVSLGVIPILLSGPKGTVTVYALLDSGANTTLIRKDIIKRVGIDGSTTELKINTINGELSIDAVKCDFVINSMDSTDSVKVTGAFAVEGLPIKLKASCRNNIAKKWPHLIDVPMYKGNGEPVVMIIGCDQPKAHWVRDIRLGGESQPFGMKTPLGWIVLGPSNQGVARSVYYTEAQESDASEKLETMITQLYNNEFQDLGDNEGKPSRDELDALNIVTKGTRKERGRYIVPLPWKAYPPQLTDNKYCAVRRLIGLNRRFNLNPELAVRYNTMIQDQVRKGYVTKLSDREIAKGLPSWYLPHHPVFNPRKPDKLRIVFDCAANHHGNSINDCLNPGPDTIANLVGVLMRFRKLPVVIMADIEEMFLQVGLKEDDQD